MSLSLKVRDSTVAVGSSVIAGSFAVGGAGVAGSLTEKPVRSLSVLNPSMMGSRDRVSPASPASPALLGCERGWSVGFSSSRGAGEAGSPQAFCSRF